ncbi:response regulator transcription factor [Vagococcus carniphilus]|uniref:Response regulator transcription factor n=1 Tax=Vagococcus carniphilus TaxID=218144 RepID=A0AAW8U2I4_9ENTE|nr:response regulator transcription factor [Vagococcus carniphilus]MDT2830472.1 response regulator transcription factor [Vagococcus carniphilus]MDT2832507.1 response regulator transcription factor [Vagococcus carniphilus]MDT2839959.1 response regulator transcription factor [Vagococcus carniphilus]MDT2854450.1 response regulator transcription factor [Vagococcus carniphilus]
MSNSHILLVEDEASLASFIQTELQFEGYEVTWAKDGQEALSLFESKKEFIDLILLDWMLPIYDGITVARRIRKQSDMPIIMMTARNQTTDIVIGLDTGLDDYLTKPFEIEELFARIRVIERRLDKQEKESIQIGYQGITMDIAKHQVSLNQEVIDLTPKEFGLLYELIKTPEIVKTRDELLNEVWDYDYDGQTNVVDVYIRTLRNKLGAKTFGKMIQTVRGVGYVLRKEDD